MRALVFTAPGQAEVTDAECRAPGPGEVVVRSRMVGICHSDLELLAGRYIIPISYPITPGHEWAGEVAETGPGVDDLSRATRWSASAWSGPAAGTTSGSPSPARPPSASWPGPNGCTSSRRSSPSPRALWSSRSASPTPPSGPP